MASHAHGVSTTVISPDGQYLAQVTGSKVSIYSAIPLDDGSRFIGSITLKEPLASQLKVIRISSRKGTHDSRYQKKISVSSSLPRRILCAGESRVSVYDLESGNWVADVDNPGGTCVEFGANESEVLILNAWMTKASIADVDTGRIMVIKSPKACSPQAQGHGYRPRTGQFAILLKPEATDLLTIHEPSSYDVISKVSLPTVDAQGLKWSPDGRWLAVWDTASSGTRVSIYTADGQFLRTYTGPKDLDNTHDLGVRAVEWAPADKDQKTPYLIVGKNDGTADVVNARTFSCSTVLSHTFHTPTSAPPVWCEQASPSNGEAEYAEASAFDTTPDSSGLPRGVSVLQFSHDGSFLGTVDQSRPNVVWIWSFRPSMGLVSALIHNHNVRQVLWHPSREELLVTTTNPAPTVYTWSSAEHPAIARVPIARNDAGKYEVAWVSPSTRDEPSTFWLTASGDAVLGQVTNLGEGGQRTFNIVYSTAR